VRNVVVYVQAHPGQQILVTANTNIAVDNVALALMRAGVKVVRVGSSPKISTELEERSLQKLVEDSDKGKQAKALMQEVWELRKERRELYNQVLAGIVLYSCHALAARGPIRRGLSPCARGLDVLHAVTRAAMCLAGDEAV
jgi:superfamily I DNA and/or RNA helicase